MTSKRMSGHKNFNRLRDELCTKSDYSEMLQREHDARERGLTHTVVELAKPRAAWGTTQQQIADAWDSTQANVSQIEHTRDIYLSTLRSYVEALGGRLAISAVFPEETINLTPAPEPPVSRDDASADEALTG